MQDEQLDIEGANQDIGFFERYLTVWVALCIGAGILIGQFLPFVPDRLGEMSYAEVNLPIAVLIWVMIFPMMLQIDFKSIVGVCKEPKGLTITLVTNWLIKPFTMFAIAWFFFHVVFDPFITEELQMQYLAGAVLLGAAPCTAMVFVWSYLTDGDAPYTLVQVAINDLIMLFAFAPIVMVLLGLGDIIVPWETVMLSLLLYVVVPLLAGYATRTMLINAKGREWFSEEFLPLFGPVTMIGLLATLVLIFSFQGEVILQNPLHIGLIATPLIIQTFFIFCLAYGWAKLWDVRHCIAAPAALIGSSNFFELAVAAAIIMFGIDSGAALATTVSRASILTTFPVRMSRTIPLGRTPDHARSPRKTAPLVKWSKSIVDSGRPRTSSPGHWRRRTTSWISGFYPRAGTGSSNVSHFEIFRICVWIGTMLTWSPARRVRRPSTNGSEG